MLRVLDRAGAQPEHAVIARLLLLQPRQSCGAPGKRVGPVQRAGQLDQQVACIVAPAHVGQLMAQHDALALGVPPPGGRGQQHDRTDEPPAHRHGQLATQGEQDRPARAELRGHLVAEFVERALPEGRRPALRRAIRGRPAPGAPPPGARRRARPRPATAPRHGPTHFAEAPDRTATWHPGLGETPWRSRGYGGWRALAPVPGGTGGLGTARAAGGTGWGSPGVRVSSGGSERVSAGNSSRAANAAHQTA